MNSTDSSVKINWLNKQNWRNCFASTLICLAGCSIGAMGTAFYITNINLIFVLLISLVVGFISCLVFMIFWHILFSKMNIGDAFKISYKMSLVSILIMMVTENVIILFIMPKFFSDQMQMDMSATYNFKTMFIAMGFGFLFSLPYNYYQLQKTGKICHEN